ncbi:transcription initiation factor TFIID subunit 1 isoform X2 [Durio zibethinus]|uniref:Transcription initiation factor TFIID subunit 1 isoform X2 n=1 Tax=Durio zibethinus TaxID=66656 RepID=A0A6P5X1L1_DURZI|nr:transcription initiation factor TFIID subunit 1 isoform X2 [Durio zibethinus]
MLLIKVMLYGRKIYLMQFFGFYYDEKAETAVDYEDIDEEYDGPEIQAATEEDHLLPQKEYFTADVSSALEPKASVFDDENYDEDEEIEKEQVVISEQEEHLAVTFGVEKSPEHDVHCGSSDNENQVDGTEDFQEVPDALEEPLDCKGSTALPVLCVEDGEVILRFSEIFGIHEPLKKGDKRDHGYFTHREKYKSMDASDLFEEDEEVFLKDTGQCFSFFGWEKAIQQDISEFTDEPFVQGGLEMSAHSKEHIKDSYPSPEPMKEGLLVDISSGGLSPSCLRFFPLDQLDWEEQILWDNSPAISGNSLESPEISVSDLEASVARETIPQAGRKLLSEQSTEPYEKDRDSGLCCSSVFLESFDSKNSPGSKDLQFSESRFHPQLLRLEPLLGVDSSNDGDSKREYVALEPDKSDLMRCFRKLTLQNRDMIEGSWLDNIMWEPRSVIAKPKLILDLQDEQMLFEILDNKESKHLQLHAGAMIITQPVKPSSRSSEVSDHKYQTGWQFNIANDKFYVNRKVSQQLQSNSNKRMAHGVRVHHSVPALKLQTMKLKLSNKDIANFHRPRAIWYPHDIEVAVRQQGRLPTQGPMKVILKSLGGKGSKLHVDAEETVSSVKAKASKKLDFKPAETVKIFYLGKELADDKSLAAQNVQPNSLLHLIRTRIHLWPRAQKLPRENKSLRPPGAFKKKSDLCVKDGHVFLMEYCEERPLLLSNAGMGANLCTYHQKTSSGDQISGLLRNGNQTLGNVLLLEPTDKSPFLGDIKAGCSQSSLETNMYKAPIFSHKVPSTDFLLVRSPKGKLSIRRIDKIAVVGQQEPLMEVFAPGSKNIQTYLMNRMLIYVYREFSAAAKRGLTPFISTDELSIHFPNLSDAIVRKKLKECAYLRRDKNGRQIWSMKPDFHIPPEGVLRKLVSPEHVCAYESMLAGLYRLRHLGITRLTTLTSVSSAMSQLPDEAIALAAASHIERELQITPWNLSSNFVACTSQDRDNIERLEITGVGDPSGRGLGFSYVRTAPKAPMSNAMMKKKTAAARGGSSVTGTDADLRRLSMEAAREVLLKFNVPDEVIAKQTRWHRIAMIRKLSSEQAASGVKVDPTTISKYARGQRMSFLQLQQQTREKCQEIWDRQIQSLSAVDGEENESDSEANSDLDSFAGDLENLLDAEECEEGEEGNNDNKIDKGDGVKGLKMRRRPSKAQAQEEIDDEAAEAAELCRLLMDDDDEQKKKKKKKIKALAEDAALTFGLQSRIAVENVRVKKASKISKQIIHAAQPNGSYATNENIVKDSKDIESRIFKGNLSGKVKGMKKNGMSSTGPLTKVKILGDNVKLFKEKKSSRETFVCGACGQLGHMRTNKNCPKYGEDPEIQVEATDLEKPPGKSTSLEPSGQSQLKIMKKKLITKSTTKIAVVEASEGEKSSSNAKSLPLKFKCSTDRASDKLASGGTQSSDHPVTSDPENGIKSVAKVSKIIISNRAKPDEMQVESNKLPIVIRNQVDTDRGQVESHKKSIVIRPPTNVERDQVEPHKPSVVIRPPGDKDRDQPHKKIIIKRPKEIIDLDQISPEGGTYPEYRKTKRIVELSSFEKQGKQESLRLTEPTARRKAKEERRWWAEEEKKRNMERIREDRARKLYEEEMRLLEERERFAEITRYTEDIRREREEEERQKAKKKKKKKKVEIKDDYLEDYRTRRNDKRMLERDRGAKRKPVELGQYGAEYVPPTKRRRGGEVGLSNILEQIVEALRATTEVSYLFLKPVSKKEAPDYLDIVERPMDLSTIRDKVRRMEYKNREDFRHDVWQIAYNAHIYNDGRNPGIPPLADQLLEICEYLIDDYRDSLDEAEAGIDTRET